MAPYTLGLVAVALLPIACFMTLVLSSQTEKTNESDDYFQTNQPIQNLDYNMPTKATPTDNVTSQNPKVTGMFQTTGPVNIYLFGGRATYDTGNATNDKLQSMSACDCPAGPQGPKGDQGPQGPRGPQGIPGKTIIQHSYGGQSPFAAFTVVMEERFGPHDVYKVVLFDSVVTNIGDGYSYNNGLFHAPYSGVYQFHVHIHTVDNHRAEVKLRVKNKEQLSIWADGMLDNGSHEMGSSNSLIIYMKTGDLAYCVLPKGQVLAGLRFTSFSGYLLHADPQEVYANQGQSVPQSSYINQNQGQIVSQASQYSNQGQGHSVPQEIPQLPLNQG